MELDKVLKPVIAKLASGSPVLLIGFPIPEKVGGPDCRLHWLALQLPERSPRLKPGFRNTGDGQWLAYKTTALAGHQPLYWLNSENWHPAEIAARGQLSGVTTGRRFLILGAGAIGSVVSEMLARAGVRDITVVDPDRFEVGNLVRHTLLASDIGQQKASGLEDRLSDATVHTNVSAIDSAFPPDDGDHAEQVKSCDIVIDTTGEDAVSAHMSRFAGGVLRPSFRCHWVSTPSGCSLLQHGARRFPMWNSWSGSNPGYCWNERSTTWKTCPGTDPGAGIHGTLPASTTCG